MPDMAPSIALEFHDDPRHHARIGANRVFPAHLDRLGRHRIRGVINVLNGTGDEVSGGPDGSLAMISDVDPTGDV